MVSKQEQEKRLTLIPKAERYIGYMIEVIIKLPRTEKFSIGTEYKKSMYLMLKDILAINKIKDISTLKIQEEIQEKINKIDANLNTQRIYLRIMKKYKWIDEKKFYIAIGLIYEIGKILGGLENIMPKTVRNRFYKKLTYEKLYEVHIKSRKGKGYRKEIIEFNIKQEEYIMWLLEKLKNKTYKHGGYSAFYVIEPKVRKIEKSKYMDSIVHRWLVDNFLKEAFVPQFISTTYACLQERGMHKACLDLQKGMKHCKNKWNQYYILKMDVAKYFENINKKILLKIIKRKIKDKDIIWLINEILYAQNREKGLEIGNYTSQMFANIYLNEIDQYIKHELRVKYYYRYMDDGVILVKTKNEAKEILEKIKSFFKNELQLELNKKTQIFKSKQGVNFCGYKINEYRLKIRDKGKRKLKKKIKILKEEIKQGKTTSKEAKKYLAGHLGYLKIANTYNLENKLFYIQEK